MEKLRTPALLVIVAGIVAAGTCAGVPAPENQAAWRRPAPGLWFEGDSQSISEEPIWIDSGALTLELWIETAGPAQPGNQEIVSFVDGAGVHRLLVGRFPGGLLLRGRLDNPTGDPRRDRYVDLPIRDGVHHLALTVGALGALLYLDGRPTGLELPNTRARVGERFGGKLLLGTSGSGSARWRGAILALAIHRRSLSPAEIGRHAILGFPESSGGSPTNTASSIARSADLAEGGDVVALYPFDEGAGRRAASQVPHAPPLVFPERILRPTRHSLLSPPTARWKHPRWLPLDIGLNVIAFVPFGLFAAWGRGRRGIAWAVIWGLALSLAIELAQPWIPGRDSSLMDWICNGLGALSGAVIASGGGKLTNWLHERSKLPIR
ncbi:MAG: VanZ family protein [Deltaproteobacteria bacterium]|nr:VanZ family protein [Deltaproteobacteria bacterium]MBW2419616.1 VanZ family protein [Deltaproteobacteria bacterium]